MEQCTTAKNLKRSRSRRAWFNWLKSFDTEARQLPRAESWLLYPGFFFVRYPRLRPKAGGDAKRRHHLESGAEALWQVVATWERRLTEHSKARSALKGLNSNKRKQLAALVLDTIADLGEFKARRRWHGRLRGLANEEERRSRVLRRKRNQALHVVQVLHRYARRLDSLLGRHDRLKAEAAIKALSGDEPSWSFRSLLNDPLLHPVPSDPIAFSMVKLYWFFRYGCGLSGDESEVRVALIRNAFWQRYGVSPVVLRPEYATGESRGCDAVRNAVRRFRF